ncbi:hypothetical protein M0811_12444 [Anaeramoeba ignava]|uniref:Uncharacterized protein n=1 Tax=Anaeramoeba ignava TaxID=1746090 RepID=A0A9Q0R5N0_ANAIG|nr:hypothetical protein M0811_12444 [Anaeramoeba ignava]
MENINKKISFQKIQELVESLEILKINDLYTKKWNKIKENLHLLNNQAFQETFLKETQENVTKIIHEKEKFNILIHNLLICEIIEDKICEKLEFCQYSFLIKCDILYLEAAILNLISIYFFDGNYVLEIEKNYMIEFIDFICKQMNNLKLKLKTKNKNGMPNLINKIRKKIAKLSIGVFWLISEKIANLHLDVISRIILENGMMFVVSSTLQIWKQQKKINSNSFLLDKSTLQMLFILNNLLNDQHVRSIYQITQFRKSTILSNFSFLSEKNLLQYPQLQSLKNAFIELSFISITSSSISSFDSKLAFLQKNQNSEHFQFQKEKVEIQQIIRIRNELNKEVFEMKQQHFEMICDRFVKLKKFEII